MNPQNVLYVKQRVKSVLAGAARTPLWPSFGVFPGIYCANALLHARRAWTSWLGRCERVRDVGAVLGEDSAVEAS